jgi:phenylacetate-CoA ligase
MDVRLVLRVLALRRELSRRENWDRSQLVAYQDRSLRVLRKCCYALSPFYRRFHEGLAAAPLSELPVLTKAKLMENFDEVVTDRAVRLADVESHLDSMRGAARLHGRFFAAATAGTTGMRGVFLWNLEEWASILASYSRPYA